MIGGKEEGRKNYVIRHTQQARKKICIAAMDLLVTGQSSIVDRSFVSGLGCLLIASLNPQVPSGNDSDEMKTSSYLPNGNDY